MIGAEIHRFASQLFPMNRSLTGVGVRETLQCIKEKLPDLEIHSVPSGSKAFDWEVPQEWFISDAFIVTPDGTRICDFQVNNLHILGYSCAVDEVLPLHELQKHLHSLPDQPDAIPYVTSYYQKNWGFCISENERKQLVDGNYRVKIDSKHFNGHLNYGELEIKGRSSSEIFISCYICHPSMANNELSGPCLTTFLARWVSSLTEREHTYRFVFLPETIGSICYLSKNIEYLKCSVIAGFNLTCIGDERQYSLLPSRLGNTLSDKVARHVLKHIAPSFVEYEWRHRGSDERQYCAPGVDLPIATLMRSKFGEFPEYHTSLDNLSDVVTPTGLEGSFQLVKLVIKTLESIEKRNSMHLCEPQMGRRGLYSSISKRGSHLNGRLLMDVLTFCDGQHDCIDIADKLLVPAWEVGDALQELLSHKLIY